MSQERFWNWKDNDSTDKMNRMLLGILTAGRYRGFDATLGSSMNLVLGHTVTGASEVRGSTLVNNIGVALTKQGVMVKEDAALASMAINTTSTLPRIDLIVMQHQYVATTGGSAAFYLVIQGTPNASPVAPSLSVPNQQIILGQLYLPASCTALNQSGVVYTPAPTPTFANTLGIQWLNDLLDVDTAGHTNGTAFSDAFGLFGDGSSSSLKLKNVGYFMEQYRRFLNWNWSLGRSVSYGVTSSGNIYYWNDVSSNVDGNIAEVTFPQGVTIKDFQDNDGSGLSGYATGTFLMLKVALSGGTTPINLAVSGSGANFATLAGNTTTTNPIQVYNGDTLLLYKSATKWVVMAHHGDLNRRLLALEGAWTTYFINGVGTAFSTSWIDDTSFYKIKGKTCEFNINVAWTSVSSPAQSFGLILDTPIPAFASYGSSPAAPCRLQDTGTGTVIQGYIKFAASGSVDATVYLDTAPTGGRPYRLIASGVVPLA